MILKNGQRLDGCSDTVPIGTLNPYLGSTAPFGYLLCQGQKVSKTTYPELYAICGTTFGPETTTEFTLPDLRGQTIAGYKQGDSTFGTLGGLIGALTKAYKPEGTNTGTTVTLNTVELTHSGGAVQSHTLTVNEMPSHNHQVSYLKQQAGNDYQFCAGVGAWQTTGIKNGNIENTGGGQGHSHGFTQPSKHSFTPTTKTVTNPTFTGTSKDINVVQPTIVLNWIVKAYMLIPNQSTVVGVQNSSDINVYSTNYINNSIYNKTQADSLLDDKADKSTTYTKTEVDGIVDDYLPLTGGTVTGNVNLQGNNTLNKSDSGVTKVLGTAGNQAFRTRSVTGMSADGTTIDNLYLQFGANKPIMLGNDASYSISANGGTYSGVAANVTQKKSLTAKSHSNYGTNNGYVPDMSFIAYWNGAYSSGNASNLTYAHQGTIQCKPTVLYNNATGTTGTVTLSQTAANFTYMYVYAVNADNASDALPTIIVYSPNGKSFEACSLQTGGTVTFGSAKQYKCSGTSITVNKSQQVLTFDQNRTFTRTDYENWKVIRVEGWK